MIDPTRTAARLDAMGVPAPKAERKVASLGRGVLLLALGVVLLLAAGALVVIPIAVLKEMPGVAFLIFAGLFGGGGLFLVFAGGHVMSGEAMTAAGETGSLLAKVVAGAVGLIRGRTAT